MIGRKYLILEMRKGDDREQLTFETDREDFALKLLEQLKADAHKARDPVQYRMIDIPKTDMKLDNKTKTFTKKARLIELDIPGYGRVELQRDEE